MSVATSAESILNGAIPRPKQTKLLGAQVGGPRYGRRRLEHAHLRVRHRGGCRPG
jgi:hypothetical protein